MRKFLLAAVITGAFGVIGIGGAAAAPPSGSNACPPSSPAGSGDPSCGKPRPAPTPPPPTCTLGSLETTVNNIDFGPADKLVNDILCALANNGIRI